jgi:hypothetical protein
MKLVKLGKNLIVNFDAISHIEIQNSRDEGFSVKREYEVFLIGREKSIIALDESVFDELAEQMNVFDPDEPKAEPRIGNFG